MIIIDVETYSPIEIEAGSVKYVRHPDADIICMGHKTGSQPAQLWIPGMPFPSMAGHKIYAHNALFDYLVWHVLAVPNYGAMDIGLMNWVDTQALANRYTFPGALASVGAILGLDVQKNPRGKALINQICKPDSNGNRPVVGPALLNEFYDYCLGDVESTYHLVKALPSDCLTPLEQEIWAMTQQINIAGVPVDEEIVDKILSYIETFSEEMTRRVPEITNGEVEKVTQVQRMVAWIQSRGIDISDLQAPTVTKLLKSDIPEDVREICELRQTIGRSSTAKYRKIKEMAINGRVCNNLHYYGAATGRWAGRGFQLHNLPRAKVEDPDFYIDKFDNYEPVDDPVNIAKALIRPMIHAQPGRTFIVSDYKAVEYVLLIWLAGETEALQAYKSGRDQYKDMAAYLYEKRYEDITDNDRQFGKVIVLGCGYIMGANRLVETAADWGMRISNPEAYTAVQAYRTKYSMVKKLWYRLLNCAVSAIQDPGIAYECNGCVFKVVKDRNGNRWLLLTLPSGRNMYYNSPFLVEDKYGPIPGHYGINPYSKKWSRLRLTPGRIIENIIQGLGRDCLAAGMLNVQKNMPEVQLIGCVHDEAIGETYEEFADDNALNAFNYHLCDMPAWAEGLPLEAEGWIGTRYKK